MNQASPTTAVPLDRYRMLLRLQLAAAIGCVFIFLYATRYRANGAFFRVVAVGILIAGAALVMGFLLGFIFGVPRTAKPGDAANTTRGDATTGSETQLAPGALGTVETNSNLVDISDWLTKILVGVGLVELNKIPHALRMLSTFFGNGLRAPGSTADTAASEAFALGIVLFFFGIGFLVGYLWTRLYFQSALSHLADYAQRVEKAGNDAAEADTFMKDGQLERATQSVNEALRLNPANAYALFTKGRILRRMARRQGKPPDNDLLKQAVEYTAKAARLLPDKGAPRYNLACYQALLGVDKGDVLTNLRLAFELKPSLKAAAPNDPDLLSIHDTPEFKALTSLPPSPETTS